MNQSSFRQEYHTTAPEEPILRIILARILKNPKKFLIFLSLVLVGGLFFYWTSQKPRPPEVLPLIKAPPGPSRLLPTPQALVPHQDRQVYKNIDNTASSEEAPKVEHLLPPVEEPALSFQEEDPSPVPMPALETPKVTPSPVLPVVVEEKKAAINSIDQLLAQDGPPSSPPEAQAHKKGKYRLQLGSLPTREAAEAEWERIQKIMQSKEPIFKRLKPRFERVDLGAGKGGIVYRIILSNVGSQEGAKRLETHLTERKINCLVIAP